jgi:hypothetical protein
LSRLCTNDCEVFYKRRILIDMSIFGAHVDEDRYYTLFDISSGSVAVAVVFSKPGSAELLWHKRVEFGR